MNAEEKAEFIVKNYPEMLDFIDIIISGAKKHGMDNWLQKRGTKQSLRENTDSITHHIAAKMTGFKVDSESGLDHYLHAACRCLMGYTRQKRGIVHPEDEMMRMRGCHPKPFQTPAEQLGENCIELGKNKGSITNED